ncbi:multicopper oxidase domain-containing protein [Nocardia cyriacigeorgica]|uniref:multicopper oxidase domain-containing protein n=1 Tax=Nocardia cyriacigeorgica TaxID=135487 RepID=UPI0020D1D5E7|nr:multicopper oxidase domain-containing protein [Nocardia cyriacigeorgica]
MPSTPDRLPTSCASTSPARSGATTLPSPTGSPPSSAWIRPPPSPNAPSCSNWARTGGRSTAHRTNRAAPSPIRASAPSRSGASSPISNVHLDPFQVISRNNRPPGPFDAGWKDTVDVRPAEAVEVAVRFTDYPGPFMLHCHNLEHEDMAMMADFVVT